MLSGPEIKKQWLAGNITIDPFDEEQLNPNSYNVRLSDQLLIYTFRDYLAVNRNNITSQLIIPSDGLVLFPGALYIAATVEKVGSSKFVPCIDGRSSLGRLGLNVHQTAGFGDVGFENVWCLELTVVHPLLILPNIKIAQVSFEMVQGEIKPYAGKYKAQTGPTASKLWKEFI